MEDRLITCVFLTGFVDVELVSWLLLFLSRLLDSNFVRPDGQQTGPLLNRWDFLVGDIGMSRTRVRILLLTFWSQTLS